MKITIDNSAPDEKGTIVVLGYGPQDMDFFGKAAKLIKDKSAVFDPDLARMTGANFAVGTPEGIAKLKDRVLTDSIAREKAENPGLSEKAIVWLATGERGTSSETIFSHLTGVDALRGDRKDHPYDPADLRRCRLLLEQVPELVPLFPKMATVSEHWANLVEKWDLICTTMDSEAPLWREGKGFGHKTYELIQTCIGRNK